MEKEIKVGMHNKFIFVRRDAKTGEVLGEYKAENIILNNFWSVFLSANNANCLSYIHFGSGTVNPVATDVKLTTWLGYKSATLVAYDCSKYFTDNEIAIKKTCRLQDAEFVGSTISEVGFSNVTTGASGLLTKALIKDMNGNVVSITKGTGEVLDIYATFYLKFDSLAVGNPASFSLSSPSDSLYTIIKSLCFSAAWTTTGHYAYFLAGRPQPQTTDGSHYGSSKYGVTPLTHAFDIANKKITYTIPNITAANGNIAGGIRGLHLLGLQMDLPCAGFTQPVLTKEIVGTGDGATKDFQTKFGYILNNGAAKVYVNDVETTATIDYGQMYPKSTIHDDMIILDYSKLKADGISLNIPNRPLGMSGEYVVAGGWIIAENPFHSKVGITSIYGYRHKVSVSNDLVTWVDCVTATSGSSVSLSVPAEYRNYRYWKFEGYAGGQWRVETLSTDASSLKNIHIQNAPAVGDTVAVTYQPDCIAKDDQHVLNNISVALTFNEYDPA